MPRSRMSPHHQHSRLSEISWPAQKVDLGCQKLSPRPKVAANPALQDLLQTLSGNFDLQCLSPSRQASSQRFADSGQGGLSSERYERISEDHPNAKDWPRCHSADPKADAKQYGYDTNHHCQAGQNDGCNTERKLQNLNATYRSCVNKHFLHIVDSNTIYK